MSDLEEACLSIIRRSNGFSAYMLTKEINHEFYTNFTRVQVSSALQRLRKRGLVSHSGGWIAKKDK
jgi:Mn-dependent DtxR family transcriptional regulator